ncbi:putative DNA damage repair protein [Trypanosoma theileri]|uniref:Putative DNA damage repair protein n=1 Tax=Trypanosoma theileri TaxID=67003 RepID=A0A1X0P8Q5_9TRYP|nr:putative DNA damage repair protein [Trypanosoma theileri]ORC93211.1 putative DNA damage repair protein [Trypanosoma theileri]
MNEKKVHQEKKEREEEGSVKKPWVHEQLNSLKHFQQHSRLHFIGQWKTRAHDLFKEWFKVNPEWNHGVLRQQILFAHLDMDAFFCSVALAKEENAHLRDKPVGVAAGKFNSDISSCNYIARTYGVQAGMYVNAAREICPNLHILNYDLPRCEEVTKSLYRILFELCPNLVNIAVEVYSIDEVMIAFDTDDIDTVKQYCNNVRQELERSTHCTASCGIGPNIMLARIATKFAKPNGIHIIPPENVSSIVEQLPFSEIHGVGHSTLTKLRPLLRPYFSEVDINDEELRCRHVQKLTKQQLQQFLGKKAGENFYNLCRGNDSRLVTRTGDEENQRILGKKTPTSVGCSMNYAVRPNSLDDVWSIARELLEAVCTKLERGEYSCSGLRITILERHPLHPKDTQKFMGRGKCVEFHMTVNFESPLKSSDIETMLFRVQSTLAPFLVLKRSLTDVERADELGLSSDMESGIIWTVSINDLKDIVISDIRGMTIQAISLHLGSNCISNLKRSRGMQMSLVDAFSKATRGEQQQQEEEEQEELEVENLLSNPSQAVGKTFEMSTLEELMSRDVDESFLRDWKNAADRVGRDVDYTAMKALLRVAAFRCASSLKSPIEAEKTFKGLLMFANSLLPIPVTFA